MQLKITSYDQMQTSEVQKAYGFGDDATEVYLYGKTRQIVVSDDGGKGLLCIRLSEDGTIDISDYGHACYQMDAGRNLRLTPYHPWNRE